MNKVSEDESTARFTCLAASGLSIFAGTAAIFFGLRGDQGPAALFLLFAMIGAIVNLGAYRRYVRLRDARWQKELAGTENELNQVLNHTRMNLIVDHITGPLNAGMIPAESADGGAADAEDTPIARS